MLLQKVEQLRLYNFLTTCKRIQAIAFNSSQVFVHRLF